MTYQDQDFEPPGTVEFICGAVGLVLGVAQVLDPGTIPGIWNVLTAKIEGYLIAISMVGMMLFLGGRSVAALIMGLSVGLLSTVGIAATIAVIRELLST